MVPILLPCVGCQETYQLGKNECVVACYSGPPETRGVGACKDGFPTCDGDGLVAECVGQIMPTMETCNGLDDDCDGYADEGIDRLTPCGYPNVGRCQSGKIVCRQGRYICQGTVGPMVETCNGLDDDCNGIIDDVITQEICYSGPTLSMWTGACAPGIMACNRGEWICQGEVLSREEICNWLDDDCDGEIDEGVDGGPKVDVVFVIDLSGSMADSMEDILILFQVLGDHFGDDEHRFAIVAVPGGERDDPYILLDLVTGYELNAAAGTLPTASGGREPTTDALWDVARGYMPLSWRDEAGCAEVVITDEELQTYRAISTSMLAEAMAERGCRFFGIMPPAFQDKARYVAERTGGAVFPLGDASQMYLELLPQLDSCVL